MTRNRLAVSCLDPRWRSRAARTAAAAAGALVLHQGSLAMCHDCVPRVPAQLHVGSALNPAGGAGRRARRRRRRVRWCYTRARARWCPRRPASRRSTYRARSWRGGCRASGRGPPGTRPGRCTAWSRGTWGARPLRVCEGGTGVNGVDVQQQAGAAPAQQMAAARLARTLDDVPRGRGAPGVRALRGFAKSIEGYYRGKGAAAAGAAPAQPVADVPRSTWGAPLIRVWGIKEVCGPKRIRHASCTASRV